MCIAIITNQQTMKQSDKNNHYFSEDINTLQTGQIEIKGYLSNSGIIRLSIIAKRITIDWGDGTIDKMAHHGLNRKNSSTYVSVSFVKEFSFQSSNEDFRTIKINTKGMTEFEYANGFYSGELQFGYCPEIREIECSYQGLKLLDVSKCTALTSLNCTGNQLAYLDISGCTALSELNCAGNQLASLDLSNCTNLTRLDCDENQLTSLYVNNCMDLSCGKNQLSKLDISKCTALDRLECHNNQLSACALDSLFNSLPACKSEDKATIACEYNPGYDTCDKTITKSKGWAEYTSIHNSPFLYFVKMGGEGTIICCDCGFSEQIISSWHGFDDNYTGYQCQSCGKLYALSGRDEKNISQCDCKGTLEREKPIFCPQCKSKNIIYNWEREA